MSTRVVRTRAWSGLLLWPLLLLLSLSPEASPTPQLRVHSPSKVPEVAWGILGTQEGWALTVSQLQNSVLQQQVCGKPKVLGKLYGGQDAMAGQWPWQASLLYRGLHLCGAVLIDSHWLVSTAHCFLNKSQAPEDYQVLLGNTQLYQQTQNTQKMSVNRIISHPDFEKFHPFGSDIAMLQLHLPVNFTSYVSPACLPPTDMQLPSHKSCWITGWGMLSEDMTLLPPFSLQEGKVGLIENEFCNTLYGQRLGRAYVHEEMLCAGDLSTGKSICRGDSGGPLICHHPTVWVLVGLASWGLDCRHPVYPSVFTRVAYFTDWIRQVKRLTLLPDPRPIPLATGFPAWPLRAAGSLRCCPILVAAYICLLLPFILELPQQAPE